MTDFVLASNNKKKIAELETLLARAASNTITLHSLKDIGYTDDIVEDGTSFEENALIKASVPALRGYIGVADDSGLMVDALDGAPGIYSARFSGEGATDETNRAKLLSDMTDVPAERRGAKFVCTIALVLPEDCPITIPTEWQIPEALAAKRGLNPARAMVIRGECLGVILTEECGQGGFGYDPMFFYPPMDCTFAEMAPETKNEISHRGRAMHTFLERLRTLLG